MNLFIAVTKQSITIVNNPPSEPLDCIPTSIILITSMVALVNVAGSNLGRSGRHKGIHAVVHIDHTIVTTYIGTSAPVTVSNIKD